MKAATRAILMCRVQVEKQIHLYPVAVFPNGGAGRAYAALLHIAHKTGDHAGAVKLDPKARVKEDKTLWPNAKFSVTEVPYDPSAVSDLSDEFASDPENT